MAQNNEYIEGLLEKFFDGYTTINEERELYQFFLVNKSLPENLEQYRETFQYFGAEMKEELSQAFEQIDVATVGAEKEEHHNTLLKRKWMIGISAVAASLLLLFFVTPFASQEEFNAFEGSYVKRNGVVIYDEAEIEAEYERLEAWVEQKMENINRPLAEAKSQLESYEELEKSIKEMTNKNSDDEKF